MGRIYIRSRGAVARNTGGAFLFWALFCGVFFVIGLWAVCIEFPKQQAVFAALKERGVVTSATVTGTEYKSSSSSSRAGTKYVKFTFTTQDGFSGSGRTSEPQYRGATSIPVVYDPQNPTIWQVGKQPTDHSLVAVVAGGVFGLVGGLGLLLTWRSWSRRNALLSRGEQVRGEVIDISERREHARRRHSSWGRDNYQSYRLVVRWQVPGSSRVETTLSGVVSYQPITLEQARAVPVTVYYLPEDPSVNMVDPELYTKFS